MSNEIDNIPEHNLDQSKPASSPDQVKNISNLSGKDLFGNLGFIKKVIPFAGVIGLVVGCFVVFYLLIIPQYHSYKQYGLDLISAESKLKEVTDRLSYLQSLYDLRDQLVANTTLSIEALPDNKDKIPNVLDQLLQVSEDSGATVVSQSLAGILGSDDPSKPKLIKIQMELSGNEQKLLGFLNAISTNRTIIDVENFNVDKIAKKANEVDSSDMYNLRLSLVSYYLEDTANQDIPGVEAQRPLTDLEMVLNEIRNMKYYEPRQSIVVIGKEDPFAKTPSVSVNNELINDINGPVGTEDTEDIGIVQE